jgi:hypothetical protein
MEIPLQETLCPVRRVVHLRCEPRVSQSFTLTMEAVCSSETWVLTRTTRRRILHCYRRENMKPYECSLILFQLNENLMFHLIGRLTLAMDQ